MKKRPKNGLCKIKCYDCPLYQENNDENMMFNVDWAKVLECSTTALRKVRHDSVLPARKFIYIYNLAKQFNVDRH